MTNLQQRKRDVRSPSAARAGSLSVVAGRRRRGIASLGTGQTRPASGGARLEERVRLPSTARARSLSAVAGRRRRGTELKVRCESRSVVTVISGADTVSLSSLISSSDPLMHGCGGETRRAPAAFLVVWLNPWSLRPTFLLRCNQGASGDWGRAAR